MQNSFLTFCDNWWIEDNRAYFCLRRMGVVATIDLDKQCFDLVTRFPRCKTPAYLTNSFCVKQGDFIYCVPYSSEKNIGYYDLKKNIWHIIETGCGKRLILCVDQYNICVERIWMAEYYGKRIYQVNLKNGLIEKQYDISSDCGNISGECVSVDTNLYCIAGDCIYCINTKNSGFMRYQILNAGDELSTICYDGSNFWLSGNREEIHIWNPHQGIIKVIGGLNELKNRELTEGIIKKNFPLFLHSVVSGSCIWYVPLQADMPIIYIDRATYQINIFRFEEEEESEDSLVDRGSGFKYIFLYYRQGRYIGLFSHKNQVVWEIDTVRLFAKKREFHFSRQLVDALLRGYFDTNVVFLEGRPSEELAYSAMVQYDVRQNRTLTDNNGYRIYNGI